MTRIVLSRHGESEWHADDRYAGRSDIDLTAAGRAQAADLAVWAAAAGLDAIVSSPLRRCRDTADPAATATGLDVGTDERLIELDFGVADGLSRETLATEYTEMYDAFRADPITNHFPDGEDPRSASRRFIAALDALAATDHDRVLVIAHSTVTRLALCEMLQIPLQRYRIAFPRLLNGCVSEIEVDGERRSLLTFNYPLRTGTP